MCGILGTFLPEPVSEEAAREALAALAHRGPDGQGVLAAGGELLAMRRLAVIDLETGEQPVTSPDGSVSVVQNGEIYNYLELREELRRRGHRFTTESDTEVVLCAYLEHGTRFVEHLRGMFAIAVLDQRSRTLVLARDRFGKKPLFFSRIGSEGLVFASELKALLPLLTALGRRPEIRPQGIYDYLSLGVVPQPDTIYDGVEALPAAGLLTFDGRRSTRERYWSLAFEPKLETSLAAAQERVRELLADAVRLRLRSDVPIGIFLSGGVDSSVVAYEAARQSSSPPRLFTVAMGDPRLDESPLAKETAARLGLETTVLPLEVAPVDELENLVRHYDQPFADSSAIPSLAVSRLAAREVKVVLNGDGGDEIFAGYRRYLAARLAGSMSWLPAPVGRLASAALDAVPVGRRSRLGFLQRFLRGLGRSDGSQYLYWTTDLCHQADKVGLWAGPRCDPTETRLESWLSADLGGLDKQLANDIRINLLSDLLVKMDMATMACSLEARSPLLDHELAGYVARLRPALKIRRSHPKYLLRSAYADVLPPAVAWGPKRGFEVPIERWVGEDFRQLIGDTLGSSQARVTQFLERRALDQVLAGTTLAKRNWAQLIYALLVLELWLRQPPGAA